MGWPGFGSIAEHGNTMEMGIGRAWVVPAMVSTAVKVGPAICPRSPTYLPNNDRRDYEKTPLLYLDQRHGK